MNETLNDYSDVSYESRERLGRRTLQQLAEVMNIGVRDRDELSTALTNVSSWMCIMKT